MTACSEQHLLIQAELDGELPVAEIARLHTHLASCAACTASRRNLAALSTTLRHAAPRHAAPAGLRRALFAASPRRYAIPASFAAGAALAACLALLVLPPAPDPLPDAMVAAHIRALQPGHLIDVLSTDRHTVKPWFDGKLPFAPPVKDLAAQGYMLAGGRLDYVRGHTAATLVYRAGPHIIDLFVWPQIPAATQASGARNGYNFIRFTAAGMTLWAISDLNPTELARFVNLWNRA